MFSNNLKKIDKLAFTNCTSLEKAILPEGLISIGKEAFEDCHSLTTLQLPSTLDSFDAWAFQRCTSLESVVIPPSITVIAGQSFRGCANLKTVMLPDDATERRIEGLAFYDTPKLTSIYIPKCYKKIETGAFNKKTIYGKKGSYVETYCEETWLSDGNTFIESNSAYANLYLKKVGIFQTVYISVLKTQAVIVSCTIAQCV